MCKSTWYSSWKSNTKWKENKSHRTHTKVILEENSTKFTLSTENEYQSATWATLNQAWPNLYFSPIPTPLGKVGVELESSLETVYGPKYAQDLSLIKVGFFIKNDSELK